MHAKYSSLSLFLALAGGLLLALLFPQPARADSVPSAYDIMDAMNALRVGNGYSELAVDATLMGTAQATAEIMAATGSCAHIGNVSGRVAAAGYGGGRQVFATENIACGFTTLSQIMASWADEAHMLPATNANYRNIGVGIAQSADGYYYYVLHAAYIAGGLANPTANPSQMAKMSATFDIANYVNPVITATPQPNGQIIHTVEAGQSLWSIATAYGVKIADILALNGLPEATTVYPGQKLLIKEGSTPTITPTITATRKPPTRTPAPSATKRPPKPTATLAPTPTATPKPFLSELGLDQRTLGLGLIVICGAGLLVLILGMFRKK